MTEQKVYSVPGDFFDSSSSNGSKLKNDFGMQYYETMDNFKDNPMLTSTASIKIPQKTGGIVYQQRIMSDFSELGLDVLDGTNLSTNVLQDVPLNNTMNSYFNPGNVINMNITDNSFIPYSMNCSNNLWNDNLKTEPFPIEDDFVLPIDKSEFIQSPTLAELNDETLLEDLNIEEFIHADQAGGYTLMNHHEMQSPNSGMNQQQNINHNQQILNSMHYQGLNTHDIIYDEQNTTGSSSSFDVFQSPTKMFSSNAAFSPNSQNSLSPSMINSMNSPINTNLSPFHNIKNNRSPRLQDLLRGDYSLSPDPSMLGQSVPGPSIMSPIPNTLSPGSSGIGSGQKNMSVFNNSGGTISRLSSSAPTHLGFDQIWQRREPRQHLLSTGSLIEADSFSSISTGSVLSPEAGNDLSHDEGYSEDDSDPYYEDYSTDNNESDTEPRPRTSSSGSKAKERYFWQYNVQAKGPKGQRLVIKTQLEDPHVLNEVTDPVFSTNCSIRGIKHSGKARKGDGNDLTSNPRKLNMIGKELDKLSRTINDMTPVSELPVNVRPKSRKEKNKLASRACRLKKKAQHEANKIKLFGLEIEHKKLINGIDDIKKLLLQKYQNPGQCVNQINENIEKIYSDVTRLQIAGASTEFVNKILENVKAGVINGGLDELRSI